MGSVLSQLRYAVPGLPDKVIEQDVVLLWADTRRVITGTDILGRLMERLADQFARAKNLAFN